MATTSKKKSTKKPARPSTSKAVNTKKTNQATAEKAPVASAASTPRVKVTRSTSHSVEIPQKTPSNKLKVTDKFTKLYNWNWAMALLHAAQGVAVVMLSRDALFPVTTTYVTLDTIASTDQSPVLINAVRNIADINLAYIVAAFFFMSAIAHLCIVTFYRKRYEQNLKNGINRARWYEYGISASTMMIAIAMLSGVTDLSTLVLIFGGTMVMNLLGLVMEVHNQTTAKTNWTSYVVGTIAGLFPWVAVGIYFWGANMYGEGQIPTFVYYIYGSIFLFFSSFAVNMWLQYKGKGRWSDYLYGEKSYMVLSLVAKSALAWQVFAGTLRP